MLIRLTGLSLLLVALSGCQNGTLTLSVADAPIDNANSVVIEFLGVDLVASDGSTHSFDLSPVIAPNFLATDTITLLGGVTLPEGDYQSIVFRIGADGSGSDSFIVFNGNLCSNGTNRCPLVLRPPGAKTTVDHAFHIARQKQTALVADFDLRKSVLDAADNSGDYVLRPSVRVLDTAAAATISGAVAASLVGGSSTCAVYVYQGRDVTPDDVGGTGAQPYSSALVRSQAYAARYLEAGTYTVALTCEAGLDDPQKDDSIRFVQQKNVTVTAGATATADFN